MIKILFYKVNHNMNTGIVGLPGSGKTTLFRALTRGTVKTEFTAAGKPNVGVVSVPDERIDFFAKEYSPKKVTYASIEFIDGAARMGTGSDGRTQFGSEFFADVRQVDALVHVVRGFPDAMGEEANPLEDFSSLNDELVLADLQLVENRAERVEKQTHGIKKGTSTPATIELELLARLQAHLEEGEGLKSFEFTPDEEKAVRGYDFLTLKPMIVVVNISEDEIGDYSEKTNEMLEYCKGQDIPAIALCAEVEMEVSQLSDEEEAEFLDSMGIKEPARNVLIQETYRLLGLISFITAGEPEVRAWTIREGSKAIDAAGAIHSDIARGFIRAEVANYTAVEPAGGWENAKKEQIVELQGKEYVVADGDVMYFRFKV